MTNNHRVGCMGQLGGCCCQYSGEDKVPKCFGYYKRVSVLFSHAFFVILSNELQSYENYLNPPSVIRYFNIFVIFSGKMSYLCRRKSILLH